MMPRLAVLCINNGWLSSHSKRVLRHANDLSSVRCVQMRVKGARVK